MTASEATKKNRYLALDATSISTYSKNLRKCAYEKNKDGDSLPQINLIMIVDQLTGIPCYFRVYDGNVPDVSTIMHTLQEKTRIRLDENAVFVSDKGYSSIVNINTFYQTKTNFLLNMRTNFGICKDVIKRCQPDLLNPFSYNEIIDCSCKTVKAEWSYPANFKTNFKGNRKYKLKVQMYIH